MAYSVQAVLYKDYTYPSKTFLSLTDLTLLSMVFNYWKLTCFECREIASSCMTMADPVQGLTEGALQFIAHKVATAWLKLLDNEHFCIHEQWILAGINAQSFRNVIYYNSYIPHVVSCDYICLQYYNANLWKCIVHNPYIPVHQCMPTITVNLHITV